MLNKNIVCSKYDLDAKGDALHHNNKHCRPRHRGIALASGAVVLQGSKCDSTLTLGGQWGITWGGDADIPINGANPCYNMSHSKPWAGIKSYVKFSQNSIK